MPDLQKRGYELLEIDMYRELETISTWGMLLSLYRSSVLHRLGRKVKGLEHQAKLAFHATAVRYGFFLIVCLHDLRNLCKVKCPFVGFYEDTHL